jgi:queuosine precursor transporter
MALPVIILAALFLAQIPVANWLIQNVGTVCVPQGPCLVPVGFGLMAPSGAILIGMALALRDALHERVGRWTLLALVCAGAAISGAFSPAQLAIASATAFLVSELFDTVAYARIRPYSRAMAILWSGLLGAAVDSVLFSWVAFGSVKWSAGLLLAKIYASVMYATLCYARSKNHGSVRFTR